MKRRFTREFKLAVLQETASLTEVCRTHSLDASTVCGWRKDFEKNPQKAFAGQGNLWKTEAELEHCKPTVLQGCAWGGNNPEASLSSVVGLNI